MNTNISLFNDAYYYDPFTQQTSKNWCKMLWLHYLHMYTSIYKSTHLNCLFIVTCMCICKLCHQFTLDLMQTICLQSIFSRSLDQLKYLLMFNVSVDLFSLMKLCPEIENCTSPTFKRYCIPRSKKGKRCRMI